MDTGGVRNAGPVLRRRHADDPPGVRRIAGIPVQLLQGCRPVRVRRVYRQFRGGHRSAGGTRCARSSCDPLRGGPRAVRPGRHPVRT